MAGRRHRASRFVAILTLSMFMIAGAIQVFFRPLPNHSIVSIHRFIRKLEPNELGGTQKSVEEISRLYGMLQPFSWLAHIESLDKEVLALV